LPEWPIRHPRNGDESDLMKLIEQHNLSERDWNTIVIAALRLSCSRFYARLMAATTQVLNHTQIVDRDLFAELVAIAERNG
jgi:hypothetical protein